MSEGWFVDFVFPEGNGEFSFFADSVSITLQRNPSVFPIVGDTSTGDVRFVWVDLGLQEITLRVEGTLRFGVFDVVGFESAFLKSWRSELAQTADAVDQNKLVRIGIRDPRDGWLRSFFGIPRRFEKTAAGGGVQWQYRAEFAVLKFPYQTFLATLRGEKAIGERVGIQFPQGFTWIPVDRITTVVNRQPAVVPLVGNTDTGEPNWFFTDLGLAELDIQLMGVLPDTMTPHPLDILSGMSGAWIKARAGDTFRGSERDHTIGITVEAPEGTITYWCIPRGCTLIRIGQTSRWEYRLEFSAIDRR
jgi:hypothetical protein